MAWETFRDAYPREKWENLDATAKRWKCLTPSEQAAVMAALPAALLDMSRRKRAKWSRIDRFIADRGWERFTPDQMAAKAPRAAAPPKVPEKTPEQLEQERRLEEIAKRRGERFEQIKRELRERGVRDKIELLQKATDRLQREWPEGEDEPQPAGPFLVTVADGVTIQ